MRLAVIAAMLAVPCIATARTWHKPPKPYAIDGDTVVLNGEHVRLMMIDAPEMPGLCRVGRVCVQGDPYKAQRKLQDLLNSGPVTCSYVKRDYYGRWLAWCSVHGRDISKLMLASGTVGVYRYERNK